MSLVIFEKAVMKDLPFPFVERCVKGTEMRDRLTTLGMVNGELFLTLSQLVWELRKETAFADDGLRKVGVSVFPASSRSSSSITFPPTVDTRHSSRVSG